MADVVIDISVSVDGFVTGPDAGPGRGLGVGGEPLHTWAFEGDEADKRVLESAAAATGAVLMGRRTFDVVDAPDGWSGDLGYGAERDQSAAPPNFVVTHAVPGTVRLSDRFTFVTTGVADAVAQARAAAGDKLVCIMGGAELAREALRLSLVDELRLHLAPILLGDGTRLFDRTSGSPVPLEQVAAVHTATAAHL